MNTKHLQEACKFTFQSSSVLVRLLTNKHQCLSNQENIVSTDPVIQPTTAARIMMARSHMSLCPVTSWSLTSPWVVGGHISIPQRPLTLLCCCTHASCGLAGVLLRVSFSWPWPAISCCSCQLLAQLHSTVIALPRRATGPGARPHSALGDMPFLPAPPTRPSAQMVLRWYEGRQSLESLTTPWLQSLLCDLVGMSDGNGLEPRKSRCCGHLCLTSSSSSAGHTRLAHHRRTRAAALLHLSSWKASMNEGVTKDGDWMYLLGLALSHIDSRYLSDISKKYRIISDYFWYKRADGN